jgi:hypothetical protein
MVVRKHSWVVILAAALLTVACAGQSSSTGSSVLSASDTAALDSQGAIDACAGLAQGDACTFIAPDGNTDTGTCFTGWRDDATLRCRPEHLGEHGGGHHGGGHHGDGAGDTPPEPPQAAIDACANLVAGDACSMTGPDGQAIASTCVAGPESDDPLACAPPERPDGQPDDGWTDGDAGGGPGPGPGGGCGGHHGGPH